MELSEALEKITELTADLAVKEAKLKDVTDNFAGYRKTAEAEKEELTKKAEGATKEFETFKGGIEKEKADRITSFRDGKRKELSKGDEKIAAQIEEKYAILNMPETTEAEIAAKYEMARSIAIPASATPNVNDAALGAVSLGGGTPPTDHKMSPEAESVAKSIFGR